jgi:hypothetical protein
MRQAFPLLLLAAWATTLHCWYLSMLLPAVLPLQGALAKRNKFVLCQPWPQLQPGEVRTNAILCAVGGREVLKSQPGARVMSWGQYHPPRHSPLSTNPLTLCQGV